jgi:predicted RNA-binding Zn ribbon-like protein
VTQTDGRSFGKRVGGRLCLDFVNTVRGRVGNPRPGGGHDYADRVVGERLDAYETLVVWGAWADALSEEEARELNDAASGRQAEASGVLERAIVAREAVYRLFKAAIEGWTPEPEDLATFNGELRVARGRERLIASPRFRWEWDATLEAPDRVLWPIVRSAAELLTRVDLQRVGQCPGEECGWLFLDTSRSGRRRWCDMADCGNVAKARRFRERVRRTP